MIVLVATWPQRVKRVTSVADRPVQGGPRVEISDQTLYFVVKGSGPLPPLPPIAKSGANVLVSCIHQLA
jgi:hypothetical protein